MGQIVVKQWPEVTDCAEIMKNTSLEQLSSSSKKGEISRTCLIPHYPDKKSEVDGSTDGVVLTAKEFVEDTFAKTAEVKRCQT